MCVLANNSGSNVEGSSGFRDVLPNRKHLILPELLSQGDLDNSASCPKKASVFQSLFHDLHVSVANVFRRVHLRDGQFTQSSKVSE